MERVKIGDKIIDFLFVSDKPKKVGEIQSKIFPGNSSKKITTLLRNLSYQIRVASKGVVKADKNGYFIDPNYNKESGSAPIKEAWALNYSDIWKKGIRLEPVTPKKEGKEKPKKEVKGQTRLSKKNLDIPAGKPVRITIKMLDGEINISPSHEINIRAKSMDGVIEI